MKKILFILLMASCTKEEAPKQYDCWDISVRMLRPVPRLYQVTYTKGNQVKRDTTINPPFVKNTCDTLKLITP